MIKAIFMIIVIVMLMPTNYNYSDMLAFDIPFDRISNSYASCNCCLVYQLGTCKFFASSFSISCGCGQALIVSSP